MNDGPLLPAATAPPADGGWVVDQRYRLIGAAIWTIGFTYTVLYPFLTFKQEWMPLLVISVWIIARRFAYASTMMPQLNLGMILLLAWAMLSAAWGPDAIFVLTQTASVVGVTLIAIAYSVSSWRPERFANHLTWTCTAILVASVVVSVVLPSFGVHDSTRFELAGSWKGITYQKNGLGQVAVVGSIFWTYLWAANRTSATSAMLGVGLSVFLLVKSRSSTSMMLACITCGVLLLLLRPPIRLSSRRSIAAAVMVIATPLIGLIALVMVSYASTFAGALGGAFGKDASFSGRTQIWASVMTEIQRHPIAGTGFSSFWGDELRRSPAAGNIIRQLGWEVPNAHNGYLDLTNELGIVGLLLLVVLLGIHLRDLGRLGHIDREATALHRCLLLYVVLANITETGWFHPVTTTHVLAMYSSVEVSRLLFEQRLRTAHADGGERAASRRLAREAEAPVVAVAGAPGKRLAR